MKREMARGAAWMVLFRLFDRSIGLVSTILLARMLLPADFGLVAMAMSVIALIELATTFSFDIALIQRKDPTRSHYDTAWTMNILLAAGGGIVTAAAAYPAAAFYGDPRLGPVMLALALAWAVSGLENIGTVDFRRNMDFGSEFRFLATKRVATFVVVVCAAVVFRSYWTLVAGTFAGRVIGVGLSYRMSPFRPRLSLAHTRELLSFSGWLVLSNLAMTLLSRTPHFVVGRTFGAQSLGAYTVGAEIANLPHTELVAPINRAMFPGYSRLTGDLDKFRQTCLDATSAIFLLVMPISTGVALMAPEVVSILLGSQWGAAVPIVQVLCFSGAVSAMTANNMSAYQALGLPKLGTYTLIARALLLIGALLVVGVGYGVIGVAYCELFAALGSLAVSVPLLSCNLGMAWTRYFASLGRPLVASALMGLVLHALLPARVLHASAFDAVLWLVVGSAAGAVVYPLIVAALWWVAGRRPGIETVIFDRLRSMVLSKLRRETKTG
jgi:O-antigen/teichoic acid export membrane protein